MKETTRYILACGILLVGVAWTSSAEDLSSDDWGEGSSLQAALTEQASPRKYKWELGLDASYVTYVKNSDQSATVDVDKVTELNEERADLGLGPVAAGSRDT